MFTYPQLTTAEQANLPKLLAEPIAISSKFEDSTHAIWHCLSTDGEMVLKVCNLAAVAQSTFWLGLNHFFDADFPNNLGNIAKTHDFLARYGALQAPAHIASAPKRFVLTRFLAGVDLEANHISDAQVVALANHIVQLHQHTHTQWGSLHAPLFAAHDWGKRLHETLLCLLAARGLPVSDSRFSTILSQASHIKETTFAPMMLDLRWDQMRSLDNGNLAIIDLDAFVIAPKGLDLVLLQYVLKPAQWHLFKQQYCQAYAWPDYSQQKPCYQLLLFLMNILGETDLTRWLKQF